VEGRQQYVRPPRAILGGRVLLSRDDARLPATSLALYWFSYNASYIDRLDQVCTFA
jgi:hypothetical protein